MSSSSLRLLHKTKPCVQWVEEYFNDCLRNPNDEISFGLGFASLIFWAVAEIPQIITNFRTKSSHGISLSFLLAWVVGDVFNLVGCFLEPSTLPTQLYTALLYTIITVLLVLQCIYYDYVRGWMKQRQMKTTSATPVVEDDVTKPLIEEHVDPQIPTERASLRISPGQEYFFMSARSLAGSSTPPFRSYLNAARSGPSTLMSGHHNDDSSDEEGPDFKENSRKNHNQIPIARSAGYGSFLATSFSLPFQAKSSTDAYFNSRKLGNGHGSGSTFTGQLLGWLMTAVYMGGRLPQIYLNVKRGSVEGLNPLMFVFALLANATYVGSIVVRTVEWTKVRANMPWLLDAAACVLLDFFILMQYLYYKHVKEGGRRTEDQGGGESRPCREVKY